MLNDLGRALLQVPQSGYQQSAILSSHASNPSKTDAARFQNLRLDTRSRSTKEGINPSISALTEGVCPALTRLDSPANTNLTQIYVIRNYTLSICESRRAKSRYQSTSRALHFSVSTNTHKGSLRKDALRQSPFPKRIPQTTITQFTLVERERAETPTIQLTPSASFVQGKTPSVNPFSAKLPNQPSRNLRWLKWNSAASLAFAP